MVIRTYKFRPYPSDKQQKKLFQNFDVCKDVYNTLLAESKKLWITRRFNFNSLIKDIKITARNIIREFIVKCCRMFQID